jgi:hypothetical protein
MPFSSALAGTAMANNQQTTAPALEPHAVPVPEARRLLGNKSRSQLYEDLSAGKLDAVKDGSKTLIVLASIRRYQASLPPAKITPKPPRSHRRQKR